MAALSFAVLATCSCGGDDASSGNDSSSSNNNGGGSASGGGAATGGGGGGGGGPFASGRYDTGDKAGDDWWVWPVRGDSLTANDFR